MRRLLAARVLAVLLPTFLSLAAVPLLSGCTLGLGVVGAVVQSGVSQARRGPVSDPGTLRGGERVRVLDPALPKSGIVGRWKTLVRTDSVPTLVLVSSGAERRVPLGPRTTVVRWPRAESASPFLVLGLMIDATTLLRVLAANGSR